MVEHIIEDLTHCPKCGSELSETQAYHTATRGKCPEHGWVSVELLKMTPQEIRTK